MRRPLVAASAVLLSLCAAAACTSFSSSEPSAADAGDDRAVLPKDDASAVSDAGPDGHDASAVVSTSGCADGTREGFLGSDAGIAACEGAWTVPGIFVDASAQCGRAAGNTGTASNGLGCGAADLCGVGWHVCRDRTDVLAHGGDVANDVCTSGLQTGGSTFYATAQPSAGGNVCVMDTTKVDDVFGCGDTSSVVNGCAPLVTSIGTFAPVSGFAFGTGANERATVTKGPGNGGVLCCRD